LLRLEHVCAGYRGLQILHDVSLEVDTGEVMALIGANGAGKTTTLRTISGTVRPTQGTVTFEDSDLTRLRPHEVVRAGVVQVPEGRELFGGLTVRENLMMGGYAADRSHRERRLVEVHEMYPVLEERAGQDAATLSGGQQQMLAIGRALMAGPRLLMLDEPSLGLSPKLVGEMFGAIERIRAAGITVLLVEQNVVQALRASDRGCVLESGRVVAAGPSGELLDDERVRSAYLGVDADSAANGTSEAEGGRATPARKTP
jgi:branched-chain amino acid transport system ATP-binding protein